MFGMSTADWMELQAYRATGLIPEAVQEMVSFPYTADDDEEETEMEVNSKSAITKITTIAEFLENLGERKMAAELSGAVRTLKGDRA